MPGGLCQDLQLGGGPIGPHSAGRGPCADVTARLILTGCPGCPRKTPLLPTSGRSQCCVVLTGLAPSDPRPMPKPTPCHGPGPTPQRTGLGSRRTPRKCMSLAHDAPGWGRHCEAGWIRLLSEMDWLGRQRTGAVLQRPHWGGDPSGHSADGAESDLVTGETGDSAGAEAGVARPSHGQDQVWAWRRDSPLSLLAPGSVPGGGPVHR